MFNPHHKFLQTAVQEMRKDEEKLKRALIFSTGNAAVNQPFVMSQSALVTNCHITKIKAKTQHGCPERKLNVRLFNSV